jgi:hypothetical protein
MALRAMTTTKRQLNARLTEAVSDLIRRRAELAEVPPAQYLAGIAACWFAQGAPPVNDYEARVLATRKRRPSGRQKMPPRLDGRRAGSSKT